MAQLTNVKVQGTNGPTYYSGDETGLAAYQAQVGANPSTAPAVTTPQTQSSQTVNSFNTAGSPGSKDVAATPTVNVNVGSTPSNESPPPTTDLQPGQQGQDVQQLQNYLVQMGYLTPDQVATGPGTYGPQTTAAVAKMQQDLGVQTGNDAGNFGPKTQSALAQKYNGYHDSVKNTDAPNTNPRLDIQTATQDSPDPVFSAISTSFAPILQSMQQVLQNMNNPALQATSLQQNYNDLAAQANLPAIQSDMMNLQNVMNGTEDDIRDEITKAGGSATESQILGLAAGRNKTLLKSYNSLATQYNAAQTNIDNQMKYATQDQQSSLQRQQLALSAASSMSQIQTQLVNLGLNMQQKATDNVNNVIDKVGYTGLAESTKGNPSLQSSYEKLLGLAPGALSDPAFIEASQSKDFKIIGDSTTGYYKVDAQGKVSSLGVGSSNNGSPTITGPDSDYTGILNTILGSGKFTKQQTQTITNAITNGQDPFTVVKNQAKALLPGPEYTKLTSYEAADAAMRDLQTNLNSYYNGGGDTGLLSGTMEQAYNKLGNIKDPKKVDLATQVAVSLQAYRNAISGTAYSTQEGQDIASIFPGINKSHGLNDAIITGRLKADSSLIDGIYRTVLGSGYDTLKQKSSSVAGNGKIVVQDNTGSSFELPIEQLGEAFKQGYTLPPGPMDHI